MLRRVDGPMNRTITLGNECDVALIRNSTLQQLWPFRSTTKRHKPHKKETEKMSKTTTVGILVVAGAALTLVAHTLNGGVSASDLQNLISALAGVGLILAHDAP